MTAANVPFRRGISLGWMLSLRDIKNRYANSYAGIAWSVGVPLLNALITVLVFSILMSGRMGERYNDVPFPIFFFVPFVLWMLFSEIVGRSPSVLKEHGYLITKIAFPTWVLPFVPLASTFLSQLILFILVCGMFIYNHLMPAEHWYVFGLLWVICLMFSMGVSYAVSAISVYIPDMVQTIPVALNIIFWLTPLLYPPSLVENSGRSVVRAIIMDFNPFFYFVEITRIVVFIDQPVPWMQIAGLAAFSLLTLVLGYLVFHKLKSGFADVI